jgi:hypothetical protein
MVSSNLSLANTKIWPCWSAHEMHPVKRLLVDAGLKEAGQRTVLPHDRVLAATISGWLWVAESHAFLAAFGVRLLLLLVMWVRRQMNIFKILGF